MPTDAASTTTLLAIDDVSLPLKRNLCYYLSKPTVRQEPVLLGDTGNPNAPDNGCAHFYGGVVRDAGLYRMWYYACHWGDDPNPLDPIVGNLIEGPICYAESDDGLTWRKLELGQVEWRGSKRNNIIRLATTFNEGVHVIRDDKDPNPSRRYKMVYNDRPKGRNFWTIRTATSPDGLHWTDGPELPFDGFIEQACLYEFNGCYYVSGQMLLRSEGGHASGRQGYTIVSPDFEHWLPEWGESFLLPEPADHDARGVSMNYDQVHIGVGAASFGNVAVGLYCIWHNRAKTEEKDWFGLGTTSGDFGLVISNDGLHFREPVKGHIFLHRDESRPRMPEGVQFENILCQGNGILNVGDETRIYHGRWANTLHIKDYHGEIALATLPKDRWGALGLFPDATQGSVWTAPLTLPPGARISLNADSASAFRVDVADERFALLPEYSNDGGARANGEGLSCPLTWPNGQLPSGRPLRLRLRLSRAAHPCPRLYAIYIAPE